MHKFSYSTDYPSVTSAGYDNILSKLLKLTNEQIKKPLYKIFNASLSIGYFPDLQKIARVVPVFKSGNSKIISNYRPFSILPYISKIIEKVMYNKLSNYHTKYNLLNFPQHGYSASSSTATALVYVMSYINAAVSNKDCIALYMNISKAFDCINHKILLMKLEQYGIRGAALKWFTSYLELRSEDINVNNMNSEYVYLNYDVPQGSILGPLLNILYVNDLLLSSLKLHFVMYVDDTTIILSHKSPATWYNIFNKKLVNIYNWYCASGLLINLNKTKYVLFNNSHYESLEEVNEFKLLGIIIQNNLRLTSHMHAIFMKITCSIGMLLSEKIVYLLAH